MRTFTIAVVGFLLLGSQFPLLAEPTYDDLNHAFGVKLFADDCLWDDRDAAVAERLGWPRESETPSTSSFRLYPREDQLLLGARPYSMALYATENQPVSVSIVFANKGDFGGLYAINRTLNSGEVTGKEHTNLLKQQREAISGLGKAIDQDGATLEKALTALLGKPVPDKFGQGAGLKERVQRWDWKDHAFLLSKQEQSHIGLRIVPVAVANQGGRDQRINDSELKKRLKARVETRPNGDVIVTGLPMVNQGPKGFCVPATMERYLRYLGIQADMYVLALAAKTGAGGGTKGVEIEGAVSDLIHRNLRKLERLPAGMNLGTVARQIDQGLPIMWGLYVDREFNRQVTFRSRERESVTDWKEWKAKLKGFNQAASKLQPPRQNGHVCLIIGYNPSTEEVAISDSWGPEFSERWITLKEAEALSQGYLRVISW